MSLEPCPFCLRQIAGWIHTEEEPLTVYRVVCDHDDCGARGPRRGSPDEAREAWNERGQERGRI